jgi:membrane protein
MDGRTKGRDGYSGSIGPAHKAANDDFGRWINTSSKQARGLKELVLHVYTKIGKHRVIALAAGVAFYSILAIFPAIAALVGIYGLFADPTTISMHLDSVADFLPGGAIDVIKDQLTRIASHGKSTLGLTFVVGLGVSLWSANAGLNALVDALNLIHEAEEKRGFIKLNIVSLAFTVLGIIFAILALAAVVAVPVILNAAGLGGATELLVNFGRWPLLFIVVALVLALVYRYGPCRPDPRWRWITWGSAFASFAWIALTVLFSWYAANFGSYNATYGSLGAIMGFMVWLWLSTIVVLLGAELDAEMEHRAHDREGTGRQPINPLGGLSGTT